MHKILLNFNKNHQVTPRTPLNNNNLGAEEAEPVAGGLRRAERGERARPDLPEAAAGRARPDLAPAELEDQAARRGPQDAEDGHSVPDSGEITVRTPVILVIYLFIKAKRFNRKKRRKLRRIWPT